MLLRFCLLAFACVGAGCLVSDPAHCSNNMGDASCAQQGGGDFCSICVSANNGCVEARPESSCYEPVVDAEPTAGVETESETEAGTGSTGDAPDCSAEGLDSSCPDQAPFCQSGRCVPCSAGASLCGLADETTPVCLADPDVCVACLDNDDCAPQVGCTSAYACNLGCTEHAQCDSGACDLFRGECFEESTVIEVDNSAPNCTGGEPVDGDGVAMPFCSITSAIEAVPNGEHGAIMVQGTAEPYVGSRQVTSRRTIAVIGRQSPVWMPGNLNRYASMSRRAWAYVSGFIFQKNPDGSEDERLVACSEDGRTWVDDSEIRGSRTGVEAESDCLRMVLRRVRIHSNTENGAVIEGGRLEIYASAITGNGSLDLDGRGLSVGNAEMTIVASTIAGNISDPGIQDAPTNFFCPTGPGGVVRNSIIGGIAGDSINCQWAEFRYSAVDTPTIANLPSDVIVFGRDDVPEFDPGWFTDLTNGVADLVSPDATPFVDVAQWQLGDPRYDIGGTVRQPIPGQREYAGADQP